MYIWGWSIILQPQIYIVSAFCLQTWWGNLSYSNSTLQRHIKKILANADSAPFNIEVDIADTLACFE